MTDEPGRAAEAQYWAEAGPAFAAVHAAYDAIKAGEWDRHLNVLAAAIRARKRERDDLYPPRPRRSP